MRVDSPLSSDCARERLVVVFLLGPLHRFCWLGSEGGNSWLYFSVLYVSVSFLVCILLHVYARVQFDLVEKG